MSELSPRASALLQAARKAPRAPSSEAVERMERAVLVATGVTAAAAGAGAAKSASAWALSATGKGVLGAVALTIAGATVTVSLIAKKPEPLAASTSRGEVGDVGQPRPLVGPQTDNPAPKPVELEGNALEKLQRDETARKDVVAPGNVSQAEADPVETSQPPAQKPVGVASRGANKPPSATAPQAPSSRAEGVQAQLTPPPAPPLVGLGSEVALLQSAKAKLEASDWTAAQRLLDQHHAEFPGGALSLEADVLRVLAWCGDGHHAEASELAARVRERAPRAPATARLAGSCVDQ